MALYRPKTGKRKLCEIFFSRIRVIIGCTVMIFLGAVLIVFFYPRTYLASASVLMRSKGQPVRPAVMEKNPNEREMPVSKEDMATELEVLTSSKLLEQTVQSLGLRPDTTSANNPYSIGILSEDPEVTAAGGKAMIDFRRSVLRFQRNLKHAVARPASPYAGAVKEIKDNLQAEVVPLSSVIKITLRGNYRGQVERVLNTMLKEYIVYRGQVYNPDEQEVFFANGRRNTSRRSVLWKILWPTAAHPPPLHCSRRKSRGTF